MALSSQSISRPALRALAVQALLGKTDAGPRVYEPLTLPQVPAPTAFPSLIVSAPSERKEMPDSRNTGIPQFDTMVVLAIEGRVEAKGADAVKSAEVALEALVEQVQMALLSGPVLTVAVQRFAFIETHQVVNTSSELAIGEFIMTLGCQVWQQYDPEDGPVLTDIELTTAAGPLAPGFSTTLPQ